MYCFFDLQDAPGISPKELERQMGLMKGERQALGKVNITEHVFTVKYESCILIHCVHVSLNLRTLSRLLHFDFTVIF